MLQNAAPNPVIVHMSVANKIGEAIRRSLPHIPVDAQASVRALLHPHSLAIVAGTLAVWAGSHAFGVGEIVDVILLSIGSVSLGFAVFEGAAELHNFVMRVQNAHTEADLEKAGRHFAHAITLLGVSTLQASMLRGQIKTINGRKRLPKIRPLPYVGLPPTAGTPLRIFRPARIPDAVLGETSAYGEISVARNQSLSEQRATLFHELVHRYFSPRVGPLLKLRAEVNMSAYSRLAFLRYLEEALAEGYAQLRVYGLVTALGAIKFPIQAGYVSVSQLASEGRVIGSITLAGTIFQVSTSSGVIKQ